MPPDITFPQNRYPNPCLCVYWFKALRLASLHNSLAPEADTSIKRDLAALNPAHCIAGAVLTHQTPTLWPVALKLLCGLIVENNFMRYSRFWSVSLLLWFLCLGGTGAGQNQLLTLSKAPIGDPGVRDTLRIDYFGAGLGAQIIVPVQFFSDENLGGLQVVFSYDTAKFVVDSPLWSGPP